MFDLDHVREHIYNITNISTFVVDMKSNKFIDEPYYCHECSQCEFAWHHVKACKETSRWGNKYIYHCKNNLVYIAIRNVYSNQCLVTGPIMMEGLNEAPHGLRGISTKAVYSISEIIYQTYAFYNDAPKEISQRSILNNIYNLSEDIEANNFFIKCERELETAITLYDKELAVEIVNKYFTYLFSSSKMDFEAQKFRISELLILLSRIVIKTGAVPGEVFELERVYINELQKIDYSEALMSWLNLPICAFVDMIVNLKDVSNKNIICKATEYIKMNYSQKITLSDVASYVYISDSYLCKIFKSELECNFTEYVNELRVKKSKELLSETNVPIVQIANCTGFVDQSYFTKVFKKRTGISPGEYRRQRIN